MSDEWQPPEVPVNERDPRIQAALEELRALIAARYPDATFSTYRGEDPDGIYLKAVVDVEDLDEVDEAYGDRLLDMQVEEGLPVYIVLDWPMARIREYYRHKKPVAIPRIPVA